MAGRIFKFTIFILGLIILLTVTLRNHILKFWLETYVNKTISANCKIEKVNLWFDSLSIKGTTLNAKDFDISAKNIEIKFRFQKDVPIYYISDINLSGIILKIKPSEDGGKISGKKTIPIVLPVLVRPIRLNLENIKIEFKSKPLELNSNFSFMAEIASNSIYLKDACIYNFSMRSQDFEITNLSLKKFRKDRYLLKIPAMRVKDKTLNNFYIPVKSGVNQLLFPLAKNPFLGPAGFVTAKLDLTRYDNFCFAAKFQDASFEEVIDIFASEEAAFKGLFDGSLQICLSSFKISKVQADFKNKGNGFINVKKESSFAFVKNYLDTASYNALIDNFKNYEYNIGIISARKEDDTLSVNLDFTSDSMGRRNIAINFHNLLGGAK